MTFSRSGSGRPPPLASRALARSAIDLSGWAARACDCESERSDIGTLPASIPPTSAPVQSVLPSSARMLAWRAAGVIGPIASTRAVPTSGESLRRHGGDQAARELGRGLRRDEGDHVASGLRVGLAEVDELPGGVDAGGLGASSSSEAAARRSFASCGDERVEPLRRPSARRGPSIWPRESVESFGRSAAIAFSAVGVELGRLVPRPALREAGDDGVADLRVGLRESPEDRDRGDRVDRPPRA